MEKIRLSISTEGKVLEKRKRTEQKKKNKSPFYYLGYVGQIGFVIAIPIAGGVILGSYIDKTWNTYPIYTISLLVLGLLVSVLNFINTIRDIIKHS